MSDTETTTPEMTEPEMTETIDTPEIEATAATEATEPTAVADEAPEAVVEEAPEAVATPAAADEAPADEAAAAEAPAADEAPAAAPKAAKAKAAAKAPKAAAQDRKAAATAEPAAAADDATPDAAPAAAASAKASGPRGLRIRYTSEVVPALIKQFEYANPNQVPKIEKIVVNVGLGESLTNAKAVDAAAGDITMITGQKPIVTKARRSIAQFKIRTGNPIGLKVTLRGQRMWDFLERLILLTLPRFRDFRGTPSRSFDGRGNYSLGMREQIAFPEIDYDKVDRLRGLEVSIVTTAKSDEESKRLLELLGMPFAS
jgi:large subunit ribosomal protein L5